MGFIIYPAQIEFCLSENCNLSCSYCFLKSTNNCKDKLSFPQVKKAIDFLYNFHPRRKSISFSLGEPLMNFGLLKKTVRYATEEAKRKGILLKFYLSTNGTLINKEKLMFLIKNKVDIQVSLDGIKEYHDANRRFKNMRQPTFRIINSNLRFFGGALPKAVVTYTPNNFRSLLRNLRFIIKKGFPQVDFFPDIFAVWQKKQLKELKGIFKEIPKLFSPALKNSRQAPRWGMLDRLSGRSKCNKIVLGSDGEFYLCDKVLSLPLSQRKQYCVGNTESGVDFKKRLSLLFRLNNEYSRIARSKCEKCIYKKFCFCPIGLYIYCIEMNKDFRKHFYFFCEISKMYIDAATKVISSHSRQITQN